MNVTSFGRAGARVLLTLWIGALWTSGYVAAPVLFTQLGSPAAAGALAGAMFSVVAYLSLACGGVLVLGRLVWGARPRRADWRLWTMIAMLALIALGEFALRPMMEGLPREEFMRLHGVSQLIYLAVSLMGLALVALPERRETT